jgi:ABC-type enterochelin transport system permease subunit
MGWGTFILGRALRKQGESEPVFIPVLGFLASKFFESYRNKILNGTRLLNSEFNDVESLNQWEADIHSRAKRDWYSLLIVLLVVNIFWVLTGIYFGFLFSPFIWYYVKHRMLQKAIKEINKELG